MEDNALLNRPSTSGKSIFSKSLSVFQNEKLIALTSSINGYRETPKSEFDGKNSCIHVLLEKLIFTCRFVGIGQEWILL